MELVTPWASLMEHDNNFSRHFDVFCNMYPIRERGGRSHRSIGQQTEREYVTTMNEEDLSQSQQKAETK